MCVKSQVCCTRTFFSDIESHKQITIIILNVFCGPPSTLWSSPRPRLSGLVAKPARCSQNTRSLRPLAGELCPAIIQSLLIITGYCQWVPTQKHNPSCFVAMGWFCTEVFAAFDERWPTTTPQTEATCYRYHLRSPQICFFQRLVLAMQSLSLLLWLVIAFSPEPSQDSESRYSRSYKINYKVQNGTHLKWALSEK